MAHSERHNMNVAVKIVSKFSAPADYLKKFLPREIEVVKGLKHPNLIRFLQAIETTHRFDKAMRLARVDRFHSRVYIIMEYAENGSLLEIIRRDSYIDETRARKWFRQLGGCCGLLPRKRRGPQRHQMRKLADQHRLRN
jgi:serine kinase